MTWNQRLIANSKPTSFLLHRKQENFIDFEQELYDDDHDKTIDEFEKQVNSALKITFLLIIFSKNKTQFYSANLASSHSSLTIFYL